MGLLALASMEEELGAAAGTAAEGELAVEAQVALEIEPIAAVQR